MVPSLAEFFHGTGIEEFFRQIIPVSMDIWILFFLLPFVLAFLAQVLLSFRPGRRWTRFLPLMLAAFLPVLVYVCHWLDILQIVFGGFVGPILLFTAAFIAAGSALGWIVWVASRAGHSRSGR